MSALPNGVSFDLGDGWQYALESDVPLVPGVFSGRATFLLDKNGNQFATGNTYHLWAMHPLTQLDPLIYDFRVNDDLTLTVVIGKRVSDVPTSNGTGTGYQNLQQVTEKGAVTTMPVALHGGLNLDLIQLTELSLPALVLDYDGTVYKSSKVGGVGGTDYRVVYLGCYREPITKFSTQDIPLTSKPNGYIVTHKLQTLTPLIQAWAQLPNGQYQLVPDITIAASTMTTATLSIPGDSFTGFLRLTQPPTTA